MSSVAEKALPAELDTSFETLYRAHRSTVYRSLLRDLRDPDEAEDVTQVTFLNAYRALGRGDRPESPRAWLLAIARNVCRRRFRARALRPVEVSLDPEVVEAPEEFDGPGAAEIHAAVAALRPSHRTVILMREFWGLSYDEIAERLGVSHSAVETLLFRARRRLRYELEAAEQRPEPATRRARSLLALPLPANIGNWLDGLFSLGRAGLAARAAGLAAAAAVGTTVAIEVAQPRTPPIRSFAEEPAFVSVLPADAATATAQERVLHAEAARAATADAESSATGPASAPASSGERPAADGAGTTIDVPPLAVGDTEVLDLPALEVPDLQAPLLDAPQVDVPQLDVPQVGVPGVDVPEEDVPALPDVSLEDATSVVPVPETDEVTGVVDDVLP